MAYLITILAVLVACCYRIQGQSCEEADMVEYPGITATPLQALPTASISTRAMCHAQCARFPFCIGYELHDGTSTYCRIHGRHPALLANDPTAFEFTNDAGSVLYLFNSACKAATKPCGFKYIAGKRSSVQSGAQAGVTTHEACQEACLVYGAANRCTAYDWYAATSECKLAFTTYTLVDDATSEHYQSVCTCGTPDTCYALTVGAAQANTGIVGGGTVDTSLDTVTKCKYWCLLHDNCYGYAFTASSECALNFSSPSATETVSGSEYYARDTATCP